MCFNGDMPNPTSVSTSAADQLKSIVILGASGAVGGEVLKTLLLRSDVAKITLLVRKRLNTARDTRIAQHVVDVFNSASYKHLLNGQHTAICTLGMGQMRKASPEDFVRVDKTCVVDFATACKQAGVGHFELLSAVSSNAKSANFYLRVKGELQNALVDLQFDRLSLFQPSMILTPTNRYGASQALVLAVWPKLSPLLWGPLSSYRGIAMEQLGAAMANQVFTPGQGTAYLRWADFVRLTP